MASKWRQKCRNPLQIGTFYMQKTAKKRNKRPKCATNRPRSQEKRPAQCTGGGGRPKSEVASLILIKKQKKNTRKKTKKNAPKMRKK
jgi:hypothetical protein